MATIKDVASLAGVSVSTVSVIINGKAEERKISGQTIQKVNEAIRELNYQPSVSARRLRSNQSNVYTVGVFWASDFRMSLLSRFMMGLQSELMKLNTPVDITICPYESDKLKNEKRLYSINSYNAVIIANTSDKDNEYISLNHIPVPVVLFNRESEIYHTVGIDNEAAGRKAAEHLISAGARRVTMLCQKTSYLAMTKRSDAFIKTCLENNIEITKKDIVYADGSIAGGAEAGKELYRKSKLTDTIYCDNDSMAQGFLHAMSENNISVPDDVQVIAIGLGNYEFNKFFNPSITVVDVPIEMMAAQCIKTVTEVASHELTAPSCTIFESVLHARNTTKNI